MTGTSCDGVDVALVRLSGPLNARHVELVQLVSFAFHRRERQRLLAACDAAAISVAELARLNVWLAETIAAAVLGACRQARLAPARLAFIASHGQTIYHQGRPQTFLGRRLACTWQLGEAAVIAARTGVPVISNFRAADVALGGQGAPLVPFVDWLLLRHPRQPRAALNIGGIANLTLLPPEVAPENVCAFDTGPGNMVMDALAAHCSQGRRRWDHDGRAAARGRVLEPLLGRLLADPYYRRKPPKSCGREQFGRAFVARLLAAAPRAAGDDLLATAAALTAHTIALGLTLGPQHRTPWEVVVSGGGLRNPTLMRMLAAAAPHCRFRSSADFGIVPQAKEALAFALLGDRTFHQLPANLPAATGARRPAILGQIAYPPPR